MLGLVATYEVNSSDRRPGGLVIANWPSDGLFICSCDAYWGYWVGGGAGGMLAYSCKRLGIEMGRHGASGYCAGVDDWSCERRGDMVVEEARLVA